MTKTKYAPTAFEGTGAKLAGGRWNSAGRSIVYTAEHPAAAVLEVLVHLKRAQLLRDAYVMVEVEVPDGLIRSLDPAALRDGWDAAEESAAGTDVGDAWFDEQVSVALRMPSAVMRGQYNVLLNPEHPQRSSARLGKPEPFLFDPRLAEYAQGVGPWRPA